MHMRAQFSFPVLRKKYGGRLEESPVYAGVGDGNAIPLIQLPMPRA